MNGKMDNLLKHALTPTVEPDPWLNQNILHQVKEKTEMKVPNMKRRSFPIAAAIAVSALCLSSVTVYAVMQYLAPTEVVREVGDDKLAQVFQGEDCILINETQSNADYKVTLLGIASGEQLSQGAFTTNGNLRADRSHIVVAIENADGTPMPDTSQDAYGELAFYVSPYIKGCNPASYNAHTLNSYYADVVENGILYRLLECDNVEIFADRGLYLGVLDSDFYRADAYIYDENTGAITPNSTYEGMNLLFSLPIDISKADPEAAENYLNNMTTLPSTVTKDTTDIEEIPTTSTETTAEPTSINASTSTSTQTTVEPTSIDESASTSTQTTVEPASIDESTSTSAETAKEPTNADETAAIDAFMAQLTPANINDKAIRVESTVQILTPDAEGYLNIAPNEIEGRGGSKGSKILASWAFPEETTGMIGRFGYCHSGTFDTLRINTFTKNADGTFTFAVYIPKEE